MAQSSIFPDPQAFVFLLTRHRPFGKTLSDRKQQWPDMNF